MLIAATFVLRPDTTRAEPAAVPRALRERGSEAKTVSGDAGTASQVQVVPHPMAKHADRVEGDLPKVTVVDRRTDKEKEKDKDRVKVETAAAQLQPQQANLPAPETAAKSDAVTGVAETKVVFHPTDQGTPFDVKPQNTPVAQRDAASFQQYLVDKGYGQMVEQARIVLKDNNAGEIRMTLHPESLGKVKVALNLSDGSLAGQIFVENQTVKDVFQANLDGLLQAFRDGGWNNLNLQVSVGGGNPQRQNPETPQARDYGRQVSSTASAGETATETRIGAWTDRQVNLTA
jgi:flagellar hook-length control protein FliK